MSTVINAIENLSVAEKAALYNLLQTNADVNDYLRNQENDNTLLFEEIGRRDVACEREEMGLPLTEERLQRNKRVRNQVQITSCFSAFIFLKVLSPA